PPGYGPPGGAPPVGYPPPPRLGGPVSTFKVGDAISWGWNRFTQNAVTLIVPVLGYFVAIAGVVGVMFGLIFASSNSTTTTYTDAFGATAETTTTNLSPIAVVAMIVGYVVLFVVALYMHAGLTTGCLAIADGRPVTMGTFFRPRNLGMVLVTGLLVVIGTLIGWVLCIIPGIIFGFLAQFAIVAVVDRSLSPVDSIRASIAAVRSNVGGSVLSWLAQYAAVLVGELLCFVGILAGIPVASLIQTYTWRKLSGGHVVELSPPGPPAGFPPGPPPPPPPPGQQYA
ncbi:hypothetical protein, partial [Mycobacterium shinjukuense]|uniref:hypothetical protein n=1 Tax=Mycobacterium shinjukuense TaxID=398694 RepID=UPI001B805A29